MKGNVRIEDSMDGSMHLTRLSRKMDLEECFNLSREEEGDDRSIAREREREREFLVAIFF